MNEVLFVEFFLEDAAHRELIVPLAERIAREELTVRIHCRVANARGGHGRALKSYRDYQILRSRKIAYSGEASLLVVGIDGNCSSFSAARNKIRQATDDSFSHMLVVACPDPHIERWYLADPRSFTDVVGIEPRLGPNKCRRDHYKNLLATAIQQAGYLTPLGGIEFGRELADAMDLFRAAKNDSSLKAFLSDLREAFRQMNRNALDLP